MERQRITALNLSYFTPLITYKANSVASDFSSSFESVLFLAVNLLTKKEPHLRLFFLLSLLVLLFYLTTEVIK